MVKINIQNTQEEIEYLKSNDGMKGLSYDGISTSPTNEKKSSTEIVALSNTEVIHYLEKNIEKSTLKLESIDRALEGLEEVERKVIVEKYINAKQWWQVSNVVYLGERQCRNIRKAAIDKMIVGIFGK